MKLIPPEDRANAALAALMIIIILVVLAFV